MDLNEIKNLVESSNQSIEKWKTRETDRINELSRRLDQFQKAAQRPFFGGGADSGAEPPESRKALDQAFRALIAGDQARADRFFDAYRAEQKSMQAGVDPQGGYFVSPTLSDTMTRIALEVAPFLSVARTVPMRSGATFEEIIDRNAAGATWVSEMQARTDTATPQIEKAIIELHEIYAQPKISQKLVDVADIDVIGWLGSKIAESFAQAESAAFFSGNGVGKPRGFLTHPTSTADDASRPWGTIQHVATGTDGAFGTSKADPLIDCVAALKNQYRPGAVWMMSRKTAATVRKLKESTSDQYLWSPGLVSGQPDLLLGFPVILAEEMPAIGTGSLSIVFGNFAAAYTIIRQPGIRLLSDPFTDRPNIRLVGYQRVGGAVLNFEALKFVKFSQS